MNLEVLREESILSRGLIGIQGHCGGLMEGRTKRAHLAAGQGMEYKRSQSQGKSFPSNYFSMEAFLLLFCLTASLLILPLILPPLPPPPIMLLLLPIGILVVLMILAFMPYDVRNIASSYL